MFLRRAIVPVLLLSVLAGCGTQPNRPSARLVPASAQRAHARDQASDLVTGLRTMAAGLNTFSATVSFWEKKDNNVETTKAEVFTNSAGKIRANISDSSTALKRGVNLVYLGDKKVTAKLGWIKKTLDYTNPQVESQHGWRINQTNLGSLINGVTDTAGQATALGAVTVNGVAGQAVEVTSPSLLPGVSKEVVVLEPTTFVPLRLEAYIGVDVVYRLEITKAKLNPTLPADIFNL